MRRMVVIEVNEVPTRVLRWYAESHPNSTIHRLLHHADVGETLVTESLSKELYPSQTWASLAMGVPHEKHGVYWYGDPKPDEYPLYWQLAARAGRRVGLMGALHSSPLVDRVTGGEFAFLVPDAFAESADTIPSTLSGLQAFNLAMTRTNSRAVTSTRPVSAYSAGAVAAVRARLRPRTLRDLAALAGGVAAGRIPRERLRTAQFLMMSDPFERLTAANDPDLAVFFTNHVAAAMHRYWFANFPDDWSVALFDQAWIDRFAGELPAALTALDAFLGRILSFCEATDRTLLLLSSMGQTGGQPLVHDGDLAVLVDRVPTFAAWLGIDAPFEVRNSMVPHLSLDFGSPEIAADQEKIVRSVEGIDQWLDVDRAYGVLTLTYTLEPVDADSIRVAGRTVTACDMGLRLVPVSEHRCGTHDPLGTMIVANGRTDGVDGQVVDPLQVAPAILRSLEVGAAPHHREPEFSFWTPSHAVARSGISG